MAFTNPLFLLGLTAILVPIILHLFNFRRYKTVYFSNVKMLDEIKKKTKRAQTLQQLIVLALRILGITALVFAFAQPFIPTNKNHTAKGNLVTIYLDNSFSMEANSEKGSLLYDAIDAAKNIVNAFGFSDDFVLTTQDFTGEESHILNKDQIIELLEKVQVSSNSHTMKDIVTFENNTCKHTHKGNSIHYYLSDFQKNNFEINQLSTDSNTSTFLIPMPITHKNNVGIDSCWFLSPIFKVGNQVTYYVRVHNYGTEDVTKIPVKLYINDKQKAIAALDIPAQSFIDCRMVYNIEEAGTHCGKVMIEDAPITFDDQLFFTYQVTDNTNIAVIHDKEPNKYLYALYGKDSIFNYQSMPYTQINYSQLKQCEVIVLNEVPNISSGFADELNKFIQRGGTLLVFPPKEIDQSINQFLSNAGAATYGKLISKELKGGKVNTESFFFKGALENTGDKLDMPNTLQHYEISGGNGAEKIISLENEDPLLASYIANKGKIILSTVAMRDEYGNAHRHALFFVPLHNIGIMSAFQSKLYNIIGVDNLQQIALRTENIDNVLTLKSRNTKEEFIPEQRRIGNETALYFHDQVQHSGLYDIVKDDAILGTIAFNQNRKESDLACHTANDLKKMVKDSKQNIDIISADTKNIAKTATDKLNGRTLWHYFLIFSLLCFLAEIIILRFWGKPKINEN